MTANRRNQKTDEDGEVKQGERLINTGNDVTSPPDGGWGYIIVIGASIILVLVDTIGQCFGIIFSQHFLYLGTSTTMTAIIYNLFAYIWCMTGPPLGSLITEFGWRVLAIAGSLCLSVATITSAFVSDAWIFIFTYSILAGIGCGILSNVSYVIVPHYFKKHRGLANGIIMAWDCGGQFVAPPIITILQDSYGFTGATLILGAIVLHCCVGAAVFHPVEWHLDRRDSKLRLGVREKSPRIILEEKEQNPSKELKYEAADTLIDVYDSRKTSASTDDDVMAKGRPPTTVAQTNVVQMALEDDHSAISCIKNIDCVSRKSSCQVPIPSRDPDSIMLRLIKTTLRDLQILKSARAVIIAFSCALVLSGYVNFLAFFPFALAAAGYSPRDAAMCMSVSGICNMLTRVIVASLTDTRYFHYKAGTMISIVIIAGTMVGFTLLDDLTWLKVVMGLWGCGVGTFMSLFNLVMVHYMGLNNLAAMLGASMFCLSFGYLTVGPIAGYIQDKTGNYSQSIWFLAGTVLLSFLLWLWMPAAEAYDLRQENKKKRKQENAEM